MKNNQIKSTTNFPTQTTLSSTKTFSFQEQSLKCAIHNETILYYCLCKEKLCSKCVQEGLHLIQHTINQSDIRIIPTKGLKQVYMNEVDELEENFNQLTSGTFNEGKNNFKKEKEEFNFSDIMNEIPELKHFNDKFSYFIKKISLKFFNNLFSQDGEEIKKIYLKMSELNSKTGANNKTLTTSEIIDEINSMIKMKNNIKESMMKNYEKVCAIQNVIIHKGEEIENEFTNLLGKYFKKVSECNFEYEEEEDYLGIETGKESLEKEKFNFYNEKKNIFNDTLKNNESDCNMKDNLEEGHSMSNKINSNLKKLFTDEFNDEEIETDFKNDTKNNREKETSPIKYSNKEENYTTTNINMSMSITDVIVLLKSNKNKNKEKISENENLKSKKSSKANSKNYFKSPHNLNKNSVNKFSSKTKTPKKNFNSCIGIEENNFNFNLNIINSNSLQNFNQKSNNKKRQSFSLWNDEIIGNLTKSNLTKSSENSFSNNNHKNINLLADPDNNNINYTIQDCSLSYEKIYENVNQTQNNQNYTQTIKNVNKTSLVHNNNKNESLNNISYEKKNIPIDINNLFHNPNNDNRNRINKIIREHGRRGNDRNGNYNNHHRDRDRTHHHKNNYKGGASNYNNTTKYSNKNNYAINTYENNTTPVNYNNIKGRSNPGNFKVKNEKNYYGNAGKYNQIINPNNEHNNFRDNSPGLNNIPNNTNAYYNNHSKRANYKAGKMDLICKSCGENFTVPVALSRQRKTCYYCFKAANGNNMNSNNN